MGELPKDFYSLPLDVQIELQPLLSEWFVKEHAEQYDAMMREAGLDQVSL
jgi:hypothetical protein